MNFVHLRLANLKSGKGKFFRPVYFNGPSFLFSVFHLNGMEARFILFKKLKRPPASPHDRVD